MLKEKGDRHMYLIKLETALPITEKQKNLLCGCVAEADSQAECSVEGTKCEIRGSSSGPEKLAFLSGVITGLRAQNEILKLTLSYEKD